MEAPVGKPAESRIDIRDPQFGQANTADLRDQMNTNEPFVLASSAWSHSLRSISHPPLEVVAKPYPARDRSPCVAEPDQLGELRLGGVAVGADPRDSAAVAHRHR